MLLNLGRVPLVKDLLFVHLKQECLLYLIARDYAAIQDNHYIQFVYQTIWV